MPQFTDANVQRQYNDILNQLGANSGYTPVSMPEQSLDSITAQLAAAYRPQYEAAIAQRYGATKKQKAAIDVDAASRGMGASTWVTDAKNRIMNAEAADIAGLEGDYASKLAGDAMDRYTDYLNDRLKLDQYNQQLALQLEGNAYDRAMDQYNSGMIEGTLPYQQLIFNWQQTQNAAKGGSGGSGSSRSSSSSSIPSLDEWRSLFGGDITEDQPVAPETSPVLGGVVGGVLNAFGNTKNNAKKPTGGGGGGKEKRFANLL